MTADGPTLWRSPQLASPDVLDSVKPGVSRRASRGFFSLFSSKAQHAEPSSPQDPMKLQRASRSSQSLTTRFDAISFTSPALRDDPAFSVDPFVHHAHPHPRRDGSASELPPGPPPALPANAAAQQVFVRPQVHPQQKRESHSSPAPRFAPSYYTDSRASQSYLALPPPNASPGSSDFATPSSSSSVVSRLPTPPDVPPGPPDGPPDEPDDQEPLISPAADTVPAAERPMSPPPDYELMSAPRPGPLRNESAPELRHVELPALTRRAQSVPPPPAPSRRRQPYDLDRIDELDESNPLGVALHHEGPFQVIASVLKGPTSANQPERSARAQQPSYSGGSLGISPGQVLPRNFSHYHPSFTQGYGLPQASTTYIPSQPLDTRNNIPVPPGLQPLDTRNNIPVPPGLQPHPSRDPRWPQFYSQPPTHPAYGFPQTQYDPMDEPQLHTQNGDPYHSNSNPYPSSHLASYPSEDNSAAYGGMVEEDRPSRRNWRSAPSAPTIPPVQVDAYPAPQDGEFGLQPGRHNGQAGIALPSESRSSRDQDWLDAGQNLYGSTGQPLTTFVDPNSSLSQGPKPQRNLNGQIITPRQPYPEPEAAHFHVSQGHVRLDEHDRAQRPASYQPPPTYQQNHNGNNMEQQSVNGPPVAPHDPRRRASQPLPAVPPGVFGRQARQQSLAPMQQNVAPSIATSAARRNNPLPHHAPKHLVMPTPLQQTSQLPNHSSHSAELYPSEPYSYQVEPTRAQKIQMVQDRDVGRHLLRKRSSVQPATAVMPPKPTSRPMSYMEPPPTVPGQPVSRPVEVQQEKKRTKRLLSKRRTDL